MCNPPSRNWITYRLCDALDRYSVDYSSNFLPLALLEGDFGHIELEEFVDLTVSECAVQKSVCEGSEAKEGIDSMVNEWT
jgi:hypothetical protein